MLEGESGETAETPQDYIVYSEEVAKEAEQAEKQQPPATQELDDESDEPEESNEKPQKKGGFQKKIERLKAENELSVKEKALVAEENAKLKAELEKYRPKETKPKDGPPDPADYTQDQFGDYLKELTKYEAKQLLGEEFKTRDEKAQEQQQLKQLQTLASDYDTKEAEYEAENPGSMAKVKAVVDAGLVAPHVAVAIMQTGNPAISAYLADNPEMIMQMNQMDVAGLRYMIGKLEGRFEGTPKSVAAKTTKAPPPIAPLRSSSSKQGVSDDAPYDEWRRAQKR